MPGWFQPKMKETAESQATIRRKLRCRRRVSGEATREVLEPTATAIKEGADAFLVVR